MKASIEMSAQKRATLRFIVDSFSVHLWQAPERTTIGAAKLIERYG
jgi:hypothetical protein